MIVPTYTPGDWYAVITDGAVALLPPTVDEARLGEVWDALRESPDLTHCLTVLARGGLVGLPPFALVSVVEGHVRGFLRGSVRLVVTDADGTHEHSATHVATWAEINVPDATALTVAVPTDQAPRGRTVHLAALAAVVQASGVDVTLRDGAHGGQPVEVEHRDPDGADTTTFDALGTPASGTPATRTRETGTAATPAPHAPEHAPAKDEPVARRALRSFDSPPTSEMTVVPDSEPVPVVDPSPAPEVPSAPVPVAAPARVTGPVPVRPGNGPVFPSAVSATHAGPVTSGASRTAPPPPPAPPVDDDMYANTVLSTSLVEIRKQMPTWQEDFVPEAFSVPPPPPVHRIRMSSGLVVPLDRAALIGRAPVVSRVSARDLPRLVTVASPNQDISRTHAQVRTEGDEVLVTDLNSTNGMLLTEPGQTPRRLRAGEPTPIADGALVDLGDGVTFTLERDA
ncbi:FHA domain-containing protein [Sanguibacter suaedae]|uniref:FHA domain-containing protein n=1 Tax=Sanguibacter suaedae TaxID=2795737 RepID=A0A934I642_9MICO|nr:FHA domain-containing protein [Sanguibacter suaedae]MBI9115953.1 FHA domain-containing protein [Sanguibacter suaedae]